MNQVNVIDEGVLPLTRALGECLQKHCPESEVFAVLDIPGEDHIFARDENCKPMFDMLVSSARKFAFVWYYIHPQKGIALMEEMKQITLLSQNDFVVKYPNIPVKLGWPAIVRYGKKPAGKMLEEFIIKGGNPQLEHRYYTDDDLRTYRNYEWWKVEGALAKILAKSKEMARRRLKNHSEKWGNIRGYCLYAGCAYSLAYPKLGFGMRDIDVEVLFSHEWFTNTRAAFTDHCGIEEFGTPNYFKGKTRWLDLMWNSFHLEEGTFEQNVVTYLGEMRKSSDRWATISQRPMFNLETEQKIYTPVWLSKMSDLLKI